MREKKVVAVIVEGPTDEMALGSALKEFFAESEVQFVVVHGDITTKDTSSLENIFSKISDLIRTVRQKYGYRQDDFLKIIHIADTDGAFCKDVITKVNVKGVHYYPDRIETKYPDYLIEKHCQKAEILTKLSSSETIDGVSYRIYFNSCNLEHVLYNELADHTNEEKAEMADDFAEEYEGRVQDLIAFFSDDALAAPGSFRETWAYIAEGNHSLERCSNLKLLFQ